MPTIRKEREREKEREIRIKIIIKYSPLGALAF